MRIASPVYDNMLPRMPQHGRPSAKQVALKFTMASQHSHSWNMLIVSLFLCNESFHLHSQVCIFFLARNSSKVCGSILFVDVTEYMLMKEMQLSCFIM